MFTLYGHKPCDVEEDMLSSKMGEIRHYLSNKKWGMGIDGCYYF